MTETDKKESSNLGIMIGELAVKHGLITQQDFEKAVKACADTENQEQAIPEYFIAMNLISEKGIQKLTLIAKTLFIRHQDIQFGTIAMEKGLISPSILELALEEQTSLFKTRRSYTLLGDILVDAGMMSTTHRDTILKEQNRLTDEGNDEPFIQDAYNGNDTSDDEAISLILPKHNDFAESEVFPCGIKLIIQADAMAAFLFKTENFDPLITIGRIKEIMASRNIIFGISKDAMITRFIESYEYENKPFKIAQGIKPILEKDASIQFFFAREHLKPGNIREDGTMDFRERGDIPQVEKGAVLAIKKKSIQGKNGKNIFNDTIRVSKAKDVRLKPGKGTLLTEDKLKIIATCSGHPKLLKNGTINVFETYTVKGDVDFETGHIDYHGDVVVKGCIENGFKVKANSIWAESIDGGIVTADENITVRNGITEGNINLKGSLSARFIQNSNISCLGDVITEKEVVESDIRCNGICNIKGVVIASRITAKMGVYARQIGMQKAPASTIKTGIDIFAQKKLTRLQIALEKHYQSTKDIKGEISTLREKIHSAMAKAKRLISIKGRQERRVQEILVEMSSLNNDVNGNKIQALESELDAMDKGNEELQKTIEDCETAISDMNKKISVKKAEHQSNDLEIKALIEKKEALDVWINDHPGVAVIKIQGSIMPGTKVYGRHAQDTISKEYKSVIIKEDQTGRYSPSSETWQMYIVRS